MNRIVCTTLTSALLWIASGCANVSMVAHGSSRSGVWFGDVGIKGNGNNVTVLDKSRLTKLSIWGDENTVTVQDEVTLPYVQFYGNNNIVSVPDILMIRVTEVGNGNRIIRRPLKADTSAEAETLYVPPPESATTPAATEPTPTSPPETTPREPASKEPLERVEPSEPEPPMDEGGDSGN
jgi:hypothetical protein